MPFALCHREPGLDLPAPCRPQREAWYGRQDMDSGRPCPIPGRGPGPSAQEMPGPQEDRDLVPEPRLSPLGRDRAVEWLENSRHRGLLGIWPGEAERTDYRGRAGLVPRTLGWPLSVGGDWVVGFSPFSAPNRTAAWQLPRPSAQDPGSSKAHSCPLAPRPVSLTGFAVLTGFWTFLKAYGLKGPFPAPQHFPRSHHL